MEAAVELLEEDFPRRLAGHVAGFEQEHGNGHRPTWRVREVRRMLVGIAARSA